MSDDEQLRASLDDAETRLQAAMVASDVAALSDLLDDSVLYMSADGQALTKRQDLEAHRSGALRIGSLVEEEREVRLTGGGTGVTEVVATLEVVAAGRPMTTRLRYRRAWLHTDSWRVVTAAATPA